MNTKNKIMAILMAGIVAMAIAVPMAMADDDREAATSANVNNRAPVVEYKWEMPDDGVEAGTQVIPNQCPTDTDVTKYAIASDENGAGDIEAVEATTMYPDGVTVKDVETVANGNPMTRMADADGKAAIDACPFLNATQKADYKDMIDDGLADVFTGTIVMDCCDVAGMYEVTVTASDPAGTSTPLVNQFEYKSVIFMTAADVVFGGIIPLDPVNGVKTVNSVVTSYGNDAFEFTDEIPTGVPNDYDNPDDNDGISWTDMTCQAAAQCDADSLPDTAITTSWDPATCITCKEVHNVPFTLDLTTIPALPGPYAGTITFTPSHC